MPRKSSHMHKAVTITMLAAIIIMSSLWALLAFAEHKSKDFVIDNFIMSQNIYETREMAEQNVEILSKKWGFKSYCVSAVVVVGTGSARISTTIPLSMPTFPYLLNMDSAKRSIKMVGEC